MRAEIITTGTELLLGEILNTNVQYLSRRLNSMGFDVLYHTTVGDNPERMQAVLEKAMERADIIITSGGLGPTRGDITKEMVMRVCHTESYLDLDTWGRIDAYFTKKGVDRPANNDKQAYVPLGAEILQNDVGTAPGLWLEYQGKLFILLPGPPSELVDVCEKQLWPRLLRRFADHGVILSRTLHLRGLGESLAAEKLDALIVAQSNPTIALYARYGEILLRLTAKAADEAQAKAMLDVCEQQVRQYVDEYIYGVDDATLAACLGQELLKQGKTIAFAESCSGGLASSLVTDVPGSSEYLLGSVVTYTNMAKNKLINVQQDTLNRYGAVSRESACEMAVGVRRLLGSDLGVSITGNAGPGASEGKPVGLVYIAVATEDVVYCQEHRFASTRTENKLRIALAAISMAIDKLKEEKKNKEA
ncbi:MAG: competence/damage-inducible protein A [Phascolarctobacterium sp.]|uniref:competence/damage-inducible protein A n=1 Tax=Phascolarctobacterium sp. TaxID=2049039 RepID=UPI0026DCEF89|nr:competence/damage-inducible protein A [Phascolarctobacterium sp.]MDO4921046.1 competence/damage-inducible protein A [Phascolarctobacterium sp.]